MDGIAFSFFTAFYLLVSHAFVTFYDFHISDNERERKKHIEGRMKITFQFLFTIDEARRSCNLVFL